MLMCGSRLATRLRRDERGATSIEYALLAILVALAIFGSVAAVGDALPTLFDEIIDTLGND